MLLDSVFKSFLLRKPFCVMARAALGRMLSVSGLDALFRQVASVQFERDLLFSGLVVFCYARGSFGVEGV